jgi:arginase family enzyme
MSAKTMKEINERIRGLAKNSVTFLGSGDFHHLSHPLINQFNEPFSLIIFDFHPDWDTLPPRFGCGSWLTQTLKNRNILKCIIIGVSSDDISSWWVQSGNLDSLKDNRVEIYPYAHKPSFAFFKNVPENISIKIEKGIFYNKIYWNELKGKDLTEFFPSLLKRIPTKQVYVSVDKDCLKKEYALSNWEDGHFSLEELLLMLRLIKEKFDIIGMDITGDYSKGHVAGIWKRLCSRLDHPKNIIAERFPDSFITATNEETNLKILELLISS